MVGRSEDTIKWSRRDLGALLFGAGGILASLLVLGAVHASVALVCLSSCTLASALALGGRGARLASLSWALPTAFVVLGLGVVSLIQALPLPDAIVQGLSPEALRVWRESEALRGIERGWHSLSLAPEMSLLEAFKWSAYAGVLATAEWFARRHGVRPFVWAVFLSALLVAGLTLIHGAFGVTRVFGIYQPHHVAGRWAVGPLLNPNNLAGLLAFGSIAGLGLFLSERDTRRRCLIGFGIVSMLGLVALSGSRGGVAVSVVGALAFLVVAYWRHRRMRISRRQLLIPLALLAGGAVLGLLGMTFGTRSELVDTNTDKFAALAWTWPMLGDYPLPGVGRGAFESVFASYRQSGGHVVFTHPENVLVQWLSEWGAIGALAIVATAFIGYRLWRAARRDVLALGLWWSCLVLFAANFADLSLELPSVGLLFFASIGTLHAKLELSKSEPIKGPRQAARRALFWGVAPAIGVVAIAVGPEFARDLRRDAHALYARRVPDTAALLAKLDGWSARYPAEGYFSLLRGLIEQRGGGNPVPWLAHAMKRDPFNGRAHLLLGRFLRDRGYRTQAIVELREAVRLEPALVDAMVRSVDDWNLDDGQLLRLVPEGGQRVRTLLRLANMSHSKGHVETALSLVEEIERTEPGSVEGRLLEAQIRVGALDPNRPAGCREQRRACLERAQRALEWLLRVAGDHSRVVALNGRLLALAESPQRGFDYLSRECPRLSSRLPCAKARMELAAETRSLDALRDAGDAYLRELCIEVPKDCSVQQEYAASLAARAGYHHYAMTLYSRAALTDPNEQRWFRVAEHAARLHDYGVLASAVSHLERSEQMLKDDAYRERVKGFKLRLLTDQRRGMR